MYIYNLRRLTLNFNTPYIIDLAGNAPKQTMDVLPFAIYGRTLLPLRFVANALNAEVDWLPAAKNQPAIVFITLNGETLEIPLGEITPPLAALGMDVPAKTIENRTLVPLRFISNFFGAHVKWDENDQSILIIK